VLNGMLESLPKLCPQLKVKAPLCVCVCVCVCVRACVEGTILSLGGTLRQSEV